MLKSHYDPLVNPQLEALKRRRMKLATKIEVPDKEEAEHSLADQIDLKK